MEAVDILIIGIGLKKAYDCEAKLKLDSHGIPTIVGWVEIVKGAKKIWITLKCDGIWKTVKK